MTTERYRLGFDIGGTFTDFVLVDTAESQLHLHKCLTTPADPSVGALQGMNALLERLAIPLSEVGHIVHGTTLVTNAIIERRGCRIGFLTTKGFRDSLEMGTEQRYDIHDLFLQFPEPLVARRHIREIEERIAFDGTIQSPLDEDGVRDAAAGLIAGGAEAIAVSFLHAYRNPEHERRAQEIIQETHPDIPVSLSSDVDPALKEYERGSTTTANAYVQPLMSRYVETLDSALRENGFTGRFHLMQSSGGLTAPETATAFPVRFLESGPAGGAQATAYVGGMIGHEDILSFDMGGTTAKACLIQDGRPDIAAMLEAGRVHRFKRGSGLPVRAPVIDMIEIGAGGGSIARADSLGLLKIGPDSAGADPGPACYGQGGTAPTVTDANLLLGYLDPDYFLGGEMTLDTQAAEAAIREVAEPLGLSPLAAAWGIYDIVAENMASAARVHIVEKGADPRRFAMVAMGGAGPVHAAHVANKLGVSEIVVPPASGAASALGFLAAPIAYEISRSLPMTLEATDFEAANAALAEMESASRGRLHGAGGEVSKVERFAEMRLQGQLHEITVPLPDAPLTAKHTQDLIVSFEREYTRLYTHLYDGSRIEIVNWRVRCSGATPSLNARLSGTRDVQALKGTRAIYTPDEGAMVQAKVYDRSALQQEDTVTGPAVIEEREATTIVPAGATVTIDDAANLHIRLDTAKTADVVIASDTALGAAIGRIESDPVGLEIMWSRLINITEECWHTVIRTAFSLIIGEAQDFACEILDAKGNQIAHSPRAMPVFNLTLPIAVNAMIERHPPQTLVEGDVLVTNDPWLCAGHLYDIAIAVPVFRERRIVAFVGIVGHVADIGGTTDKLNAREIYDEGIQIPPMKLFKAGEPNEDLFQLLGENIRRPDQVLGDVHALVAAGLTGAKRIGEFMNEYGMHDLEALATVVQDRAETAMRDAITALPDGDYEHVVQGDGIDEVMTYPIKLSIRGDEIAVDFAGAPPQTERGGSNCTLGYTMAHATYPLKCMLTPDVPGNAGCYRPMSVSAPQSSIFNCDKPKAVDTRVRTGWYIAPNIFGALAGAAPDRVQGFTGIPSSALFNGKGIDGQYYSDHLFQGGGQGASEQGDGKSALLYPTSAANTSVELFETRVPVLVEEKSLLPDSGGPGRKRGGLAQIVATRKLRDDEEPCQVGLYPNGVKAPMQGHYGGKPGRSGAARFIESDGSTSDLGVGALAHFTNTGQRGDLVLAGGSGYGDPWTRDYEDVQFDLDEGYVTAEGAEADYGCVVDMDGQIDRSASDDRRATRQAAE